MVIFKTREKTTFSPMNSTREYFDILYVKFTGINKDLDNQQTIQIRGQWFYLDENGKQHKVNDLKFQRSGVHLKQFEWQLGRLNVANTYEYDEARITQMFPFILDEEKAKDPNANFRLSGSDVEIYVEPSTPIEQPEENPEE